MPSLTAKREKLVGPVQLVLILVLFAVCFYYLLPKQDAFTISELDKSDTDTNIIGELDLAYLKARSASGENSSNETTRAVVALVRTGQMDTARELLENQPDIDIGEHDRYGLDLEMAIVNFHDAQDDTSKASKRMQLVNRIELLLKKPQLRSVAHLSRAADLAEQLEIPTTATSLYTILADEDVDNEKHWYAKCARTNAAQQRHTQSVSCFDSAIEFATNSDEIFELRLEKLNQVTAGGNIKQQDSTVGLLMSHSPLSISQREVLASTMLGNQRPDMAYPIYAELAQSDKPNQVDWLLKAAKWAQASNQSLEASRYIDEAASLSTGTKKVELLEQSVSLLVAAGDNEGAFLRLQKRIIDAPNDQEKLREGIVVARQLGKNDQAARWNAKLVELNPSDIDAINLQIDLAMASSDLPSAAKWARRAVILKPESREARERLAQVSEWSGDPVAAQKQWQWIASNYPTTKNIGEVVRLADLNLDTKVAAASLSKLVMLTPNDDELITRLIKLHELEGKPLAAASLLIKLQSNGGMRAFTQRELATLYQRHVLFPESLHAWEVFAENFGRTTEETLNRMELLWRLNKPEVSAEVARHLVGTSNASEATVFQIKLIAEIAWRFRIPELASLVEPHLELIQDKDDKVDLGKRLVQSLEDAGKDQEAIEQATLLWRNTQSTAIAFTAMNLAYKTGSTEGAKPFLEATEETAELQKTPEFWNLAASIHQKNGQREAALAAYDNALALDANNASALSGLLWSYIDAQDTVAIAAFLEAHIDTAEKEMALWSPVALAYLQLGMAEESLTWFDRQLDRIEADYNMLLTYADALEYAGRAEPARKVRFYTIKKLRPALTAGTQDDQGVLVRQYAQLLNRYGSAEDKENVAQLMLRTASTKTDPEIFWREDIAISWLMATQRHEHARLVMAKLHQQRLETPVWQELAVAMAANDLNQIQDVLNGTGKVSIGNHILALRQLGNDQEAYTLAKVTSEQAAGFSDREIAQGHVQAMRSEKPRFASSTHKQISMDGLGITETGFSMRHSFDSMNLGFGVDYVHRDYASDRYSLGDNESQSDIALTMFHGDRRFGGKVTAGFNTNTTDSLAYALTQHHFRNRKGTSTVSAELAYNEAATASALLRVAAKQNRVTLGFEQALGYREYVKLQANMNDISTRVQDKRLARGLQTRVEFGVRGAFGSNVWSTNIAADNSQNTVETETPDELSLVNPGIRMDALLPAKSTSLGIGASLSRGGIEGDYPQASTPRYFLNANVAHSWPAEAFGVRLDGGAGIRVLGGDELSVGFAHSTQPNSESGDAADASTVGVNYRYHF